ncbi:Isochorismatase-like protein [Xylariales sp. PMI_506]|nr:Isochorismatase-like protein [Xylariales sp. PMI_506]
MDSHPHALIVVDVQICFVEGPDAVPEHTRLASSVDKLLVEARSAGVPVIFIQNDGSAGAPDEPSQPGWNLYFPPKSDERVLRKTQDSAFDETNLDGLLKAAGVRCVAICGVLSEMCIAATARGAMQRGYKVVLAHDAHATYHVPAGPGSQPVPASMASRVAEWSLGDEVVICASADDVKFTTTVQNHPTN